MKKTITAVLILTLCLMLTAAQAETLYTLKSVQETIFRTAPVKYALGSDLYVELHGTVAEITDPGSGRILYRIETDEDGLTAALLGYDKPCFIVATNDIANVGDKVIVTGELNTIYSSHAVPFIGQASITLE